MCRINIIGRIELNISKQIETVSLQINLVSNSKIYLNEICLNEFVDQLKFRFKVLRLESDNLEIISLFEKLNFKRTNTLFELRLHKEEFVNCEIQNQPTENFEVKIQYELTNQELIELSALYNVCFKEMIKNENYNYSNSITGFKEFLDSINEYDKKIVFSILKNAQQETIGFSSVICSTKKLPISEHLFHVLGKILEVRNYHY
ncbi:MAG: hypothetical protein IPP53_12875 [Bacteroidetes bacterium]|nr:hypothetical protein [Bacteroidota bacterium]